MLIGAAVTISLLILLVLYILAIRPWQLRWGATDEEVARPMPGDELVESPSFDATRAVTVNAPPQAIWPWIVQIGFGRAGWYSYDWIDNLGRPSADQIIPELQDLEVGDRVPLSKWTFELVREIEPYRFMVWTGDTRGANDGTWVWGLYPIDDHSTRLITRLRGRYPWTSPWIVMLLLVDIFDIVMMRKCMLGIKQRAEKLHQARYSATD
jgi:hypothetical protein